MTTRRMGIAAILCSHSRLREQGSESAFWRLPKGYLPLLCSPLILHQEPDYALPCPVGTSYEDRVNRHKCDQVRAVLASVDKRLEERWWPVQLITSGIGAAPQPQIPTVVPTDPSAPHEDESPSDTPRV